jgi:cell division transport system permease protein
MLDWGRVRFFWAEVAQNFTRNITMALTAIGTIAIAIVLLGVFLFLRTSFNIVMQNFVGEVAVAVYLRDDATKPQVSALIADAKADPRIDSVRFVTKKQAFERLRKTLRGQFNLNVLNNNPLPNTIVIHTRIPTDVPVIAAELQKKPGVAVVNFGSDVTERLLRAETLFSAIGAGMIALLLLSTSLIMYNTIRLTVFARQREIRIMQLVGATGWAVRWPFIFEGILSGLMGALLGLGALQLGYRAFGPKVILNLPFIPFNIAQVPIHYLALELIVVGALVGMLSSLFSVSRYLQTA